MATVLLAHSCPAVRAGIRGALAQVQGVELVAEASDGEEALRLVQEKQPDIVLLVWRGEEIARLERWWEDVGSKVVELSHGTRT